jgi:hypothetical protein
MSSRTVFIVAEGPHDVEFTAAILRSFGLQRITHFSDAGVWTPLIPTSFLSGDDGNLEERSQIPRLMKSDDTTAAIRSAKGISEIGPLLGRQLRVLADRGVRPDAVAVVLDSDLALPGERYQQLRTDLRDILELPVTPGTIRVGPPRSGCFVMPDNANAGTLEDLLGDAAAMYPALKPKADSFVDDVQLADFPEGEDRLFRKPSGRQKAKAAALGALLRPGSAIHNPIYQNEWIVRNGLNQPRVAAFSAFIRELLG